MLTGTPDTLQGGALWSLLEFLTNHDTRANARECQWLPWTAFPAEERRMKLVHRVSEDQVCGRS